MMSRTLVSALRQHAQDRPDGAAVELFEQGACVASLTFADLDHEAMRVASILQGELAQGARTVLVYEPGLSFVAAFLGCLYAGVVPAAVIPPQPPRVEAGMEALARVTDDCRAETVLCSPVTRPLAEIAQHAGSAVPWLSTAEGGDPTSYRPPALRPDGLAFLQYTSGSTSVPKGVVVGHASLVANLDAIEEFIPVASDGSIGTWLPVYHDMGLIGGVLHPLFQGVSTSILSPQEFLRRPALWLKLMSDRRATVSGAPNFAYELCVERVTDEDLAGVDLSSWRLAYCGAEPIRPESIRAFGRRFAPYGFRADAVVGCYGLAEATLIVSGSGPGRVPSLVLDRDALERGRAEIRGPAWSDADRAAAAGSAATVEIANCGPPRGGLEVRVVDPQTNGELEDGCVGEVWVKGQALARGYWERSEESAATFGACTTAGTGPMLRTGDLGFLHDGELYVTGRIKDLLIVRGANIHPHDVEAAAERSHAGLRRGAGVAVALDDGRIGVIQESMVTGRDELAAQIEAVRAVVTTRCGVTLDAVFLVPPHSVKKTTSGKLRRGATRDALRAGGIEVLLAWDRRAGDTDRAGSELA